MRGQTTPCSTILKIAALLLACVSLASARAQLAVAPPPSAVPGTILTGTVRDPAGYLIPHAQLTLASLETSATPSVTVLADAAGVYRFPNLTPGPYNLTVVAPGFALYSKNLRITLRPQRLDLTLALPSAETQIDVSSDDADPASTEHNGSAIILRPADLATLSDDPDTMKQQLAAIAGPSPDGVHFYIDGFDATRLPPKSEIREIRINSNPYSAQFDTPGLARVEIFTKPGAGTLHGAAWGTYANSATNATDPIAPQPAYSSSQFGVNLSGPITRRISTNFNLYRFAHSDSSFIDATILDANFNPTPFLQAIPNPRASLYLSPRLDFPLPHLTTASLRYNYSRDTQSTAGVGGTALLPQAYSLLNENHILQLLLTTPYGAKNVNELRFQYTRTRNSQFAASSAASLSVQGAFSTGGAPGQTTRVAQDTYEYSDYFSHAFKTNFFRAGGRVRYLRDANYSNANFNGAYTFSSIAAYQITQRDLSLCPGPLCPTPTQIRATGGGASLFTLTTGTAAATVGRFDADAYAEDDWKVTPKFTVTLGLRFEGQDVIADHFDPAPRVSLAYAVGPKGKPARFTLRAGSGIFYQRFSTGSQLRIARGNGLLQQQYIVQDPTVLNDYPTLPTLAELGKSTPSAITQLDPHLRAPYNIFSGAGIDIPLFHKLGNLSINYNNTHLVHAFETRNINAPLPGTYNPSIPGSGTRPNPSANAIYQYGSHGISGQQALRFSGGFRMGKVNLYSFYSYAFNTANTDGGFPSNSYNQHADYGRSSNDIRHQIYMYLSATLPLKIQINTNLLAHSGPPFNITVGQDLNGDAQYNDRPTYATDLTRASVVHTPWGTFDTQPLPNQTTIPINLGTSPITFQLDQRIGRGFQFGPALPAAPPPPAAKGSPPPKPAPIRRKYSIEFNVYIVNVLNHPNYTNVSGVLNSPLFGHATSDQGPRYFNFGASFAF